MIRTAIYLVLFHVIPFHGNVSARELAEKTGAEEAWLVHVSWLTSHLFTNKNVLFE